MHLPAWMKYYHLFKVVFSCGYGNAGLNGLYDGMGWLETESLRRLDNHDRSDSPGTGVKRIKCCY